MRCHGSKMLLAAAFVISLAACQDPDVGQPCTIAWGDPSTYPDPTKISADYFESGNVACENLVCIVSPQAAGARYADQKGYCSKPCVSNEDCYESDTGLVCRQMVLDAAFLKELEQTNPDLYTRYLGEVQFSSYCAVP